MQKENQTHITATKNTGKLNTEKAAYTKPELLPLGDIRDVTMGGSPGIGDSGSAGAEQPF